MIVQPLQAVKDLVKIIVSNGHVVLPRMDGGAEKVLVLRVGLFDDHLVAGQQVRQPASMQLS